MQGWELRSRRRDAKLTLRQVARAAGTAETNVSAYERGTKRPGPGTLARLVAAIDAGADSPIHQSAMLTVPAAAAAIRRALADDWPTAGILRLIREMRANASQVGTGADRAIFYARPATTGDARWDATLAGVVEDIALRDGFPIPEWTRGHALPTFWFVSPHEDFRAYQFAHSPFSLQIRGVMVDPAALESV